MQIKKREGYRCIIDREAQERIEREVCPICEIPKCMWQKGRVARGLKTCCPEHNHDFWSNMTTFSWADVRKRAIERDQNKCRHCGRTFKDRELIVDHIRPISIGGDEWDMENLQTLCGECNKRKTKRDQADIAFVRKAIRNKTEPLPLIQPYELEIKRAPIAASIDSITPV